MSDDYFSECEEYAAKKKEVLKEIRAENEAAEIKELNKQLEAAGAEYVITEKVHWKPGDPVTNNAEMMMQSDWEDMLKEKAPDLHHQWLLDPEMFWKAYDENLMEKYGKTRADL